MRLDLVEMPRLKRSQRESLGASDFLIEEGGLLRTVTGVTPHSIEDDPWNVLVYFDLLLTDEHTVALVGCSDLVVVRTPRATLVMPRDRAQDLKALHATLPDDIR